MCSFTACLRKKRLRGACSRLDIKNILALSGATQRGQRYTSSTRNREVQLTAMTLLCNKRELCIPVQPHDRLCGLVVRVPGYWTEMYCVSCEVRTEFIYVMQKKVDRLCGLVVRVLGYRFGGPGSIPGTTKKKESSGSGTGSTQPREYNWGATW
jgi:hypothetical protein